MKDATDSIPTERPQERDGFANRKLIRPFLNRNDHNHNHSAAPMGERRERPERGDRNGGRNDRSGGGRKPNPPDQTNAENFYYQKKMQPRNPTGLELRDGGEGHRGL